MEQRFYRNLQRWVAHPEKARFLLTVSGGKDSVVMTHLFQRFGLDFAIAHCNFHLRGEESDADMAFVQKLAEQFHKELFIREFDTLAEQKNSGKSVEMVARELRYEWFSQVATTFDYVVTAHHADDNAETLLLNLTRGTGLKGMTGIPPQNGKLIRPLLPFSSDEILQYATENHIPFRTDKTNLEEEYNRNKIRLSVIPKLKEINPEIIATFAQNIAHFQQQYAFFEREICKKVQKIVQKSADSATVSIPQLMEEPDKELILFEALKPYGFSEPAVADILHALDGESGRMFFSPSHQLLKDRNMLIIREIGECQDQEVVFEDEEAMRIAGFEIEKKPISELPDFQQDSSVIFVDADKLKFPLTLRSWREGDTFCPFGMRGQKKLSDFFTDQKIDRFTKQQVRILCTDNQIVWIVGLRADNRFRIDNNTKFYYKIKFSKNGRV